MSWVIKSHEASKAGGAEPIGEFATDAGMFKAMGGVFAAEKVDHKCGNCWMRVPIDKGDIAECTIVKGGVNLKKGVCNFWDSGDASTKEDIARERMDYEMAGYVETPSADFPVICGNCYFYETIDDKSGNCLVWMGRVDAMQCSQAYKNEEVKTPAKPNLPE